MSKWKWKKKRQYPFSGIFLRWISCVTPLIKWKIYRTLIFLSSCSDIHTPSSRLQKSLQTQFLYFYHKPRKKEFISTLEEDSRQCSINIVTCIQSYGHIKLNHSWRLVWAVSVAVIEIQPRLKNSKKNWFKSHYFHL